MAAGLSPGLNCVQCVIRFYYLVSLKLIVSLELNLFKLAADHCYHLKSLLQILYMLLLLLLFNCSKYRGMTILKI